MMRTMGPAAAAAALLTVFLAASAAAPAPRDHPGGLDCTKCHTCPEPTQTNPCLTACPRHAEAASLPASLGPDVVILGELEDLYVPVRFNHKAHATMSGMTKGCDTCHHYTPPDSPIRPARTAIPRRSSTRIWPSPASRARTTASACGATPSGTWTPPVRCATRRRREAPCMAPPPRPASRATTSRWN